MESPAELIKNSDKLHTTELGISRIKNNLSLHDVSDITEWCRQQILNSNSLIERQGKNWYITVSDKYIITVNAHSFTIITAHITKPAKRG